IDEALLAHPEVAQAVAFAVPHPTLGEEVAAAVVLRPGATVTPADLRRFAAERLARFKVPRHIELLDAIPLGPTGKLQRIGLASLLGISLVSGDADRPAPGDVSPLERAVAAIVSSVLEIDVADVDADFF